MAPDSVDVTPLSKHKFTDDFLNIFWDLAEVKDDKRISATENLIVYLDSKQAKADGACAEIIYAVDRLVKGLASFRKSARPGYAVALTQILRTFGVVSTEDILKRIEKHLIASKRDSSKQEYGGAVIGQVMGYMCVIQSGQITRADDSAVKTVTVSLLSLIEEKSYVGQMCAMALVQMATKVSTKVFKESVWPVLKECVSCGWDRCRPELLLLVLGLARHQPKSFNVEFRKKYWNSEQLICEENFTKIYGIIKAALGDTSTLPEVCKEVVAEAATNNCLRQFWHSVIDEKFCAKDAPTSRKYLCIRLLPCALQLSPSPETVSSIISKNLMQCLMYNLQSKDRVLYSASRMLLEELVKFCTSCNNGRLQVAVLNALFSPPGSLWFDQIAKTKTVGRIVNELTSEGIKELGELLMALVWGEHVFGQTSNVELKMRGAIGQLRSLVTVKNTECDGQVYIMKFILIHAYFRVDQTDKVAVQGGKWCETPLSSNAQSCLQEAFFNALKKLATYWPGDGKANNRERYQSYINLLHQLVLHAQIYLKADVPLLHPFLNEVSTAWSKMIGVVEKIHSKHASDKDLNEDHAFLLLFLHLGLQLFSDPVSAVDALQELHICYEKAHQKKRRSSTKRGDSEEPSWVEVVTELLLSLLSQSSSLVRLVCNDVFHMLRPLMTKEAVRLILDVFSPVDEKGPLAFEDDDEDFDDDVGDGETGDGGAENESDDTSSESDDEDVEDNDDDNDGEVDESLRVSVKAALGHAADDSDSGSDQGESEGEMDDDAMFRLDAALAEVFRQRIGNKIAEKEKERQLVHFKNRCLDLLQALIHESVPPFLLVDLVLPLLELMDAGVKDTSQKVLGEKAASVFHHLCNKKSSRKVTGEHLDSDSLLNIMRQLITYSTKVSSVPMVHEIAQGCLFVLRFITAVGDQTPVRKTRSTSAVAKTSPTKSCVDCVVELFLEAMSEYFGKRDSKYSHILFHTVVERQPALLWSLTEPLLSAATNPSQRIYAKTQALSMLAAMVTKPTVCEIGVSKWTPLAEQIFAKVGSEICSLDAENVKPRYVQDMLLLVHRVLTVDSEQVAPSRIVEKLNELKNHLRKDCRKVCMKILTHKDRSSKEEHKPKVVQTNGDDPEVPLKSMESSAVEKEQRISGCGETHEGQGKDESEKKPACLVSDQTGPPSTSRSKKRKKNQEDMLESPKLIHVENVSEVSGEQSLILNQRIGNAVHEAQLDSKSSSSPSKKRKMKKSRKDKNDNKPGEDEFEEMSLDDTRLVNNKSEVVKEDLEDGATQNVLDSVSVSSKKKKKVKEKDSKATLVLVTGSQEECKVSKKSTSVGNTCTVANESVVIKQEVEGDVTEQQVDVQPVSSAKKKKKKRRRHDDDGDKEEKDLDETSADCSLVKTESDVNMTSGGGLSCEAATGGPNSSNVSTPPSNKNSNRELSGNTQPLKRCADGKPMTPGKLVKFSQMETPSSRKKVKNSK